MGTAVLESLCSSLGRLSKIRDTQESSATVMSVYLGAHTVAN